MVSDCCWLAVGAFGTCCWLAVGAFGTCCLLVVAAFGTCCLLVVAACCLAVSACCWLAEGAGGFGSPPAFFGGFFGSGTGCLATGAGLGRHCMRGCGTGCGRGLFLLTSDSSLALLSFSIMRAVLLNVWSSPTLWLTRWFYSHPMFDSSLRTCVKQLFFN